MDEETVVGLGDLRESCIASPEFPGIAHTSHDTRRQIGKLGEIPGNQRQPGNRCLIHNSSQGDRVRLHHRRI